MNELPPGSHTLARIYARYQSLAEASSFDEEHGLSGAFIFHGVLGAESGEWIRAANIAGAASLILAEDAAGLRDALRSAVVDFAVNSLDEALRILKNEIRKGQTVSVGVEGNSAALRAEMLDRGVQPTLVTADDQEFEQRGARRATEHVLQSAQLLWWAAQPAAGLPRLDELAATIAADGLRRRWLRLAARNLSRELRGQRFLPMNPIEAQKFAAALPLLLEAELPKTCVHLFCLTGQQLQSGVFAPTGAGEST